MNRVILDHLECREELDKEDHMDQKVTLDYWDHRGLLVRNWNEGRTRRHGTKR